MANGKTRDYTGKKYGSLTCLEPTNKRDARGSTIWKCICDCGKVVERPHSNLAAVVNKGSIPNCGCRRKKDHTLEKYGMIILTRPTNKRRYGQIVWEGLCECGKLVERVPAHLRKSVKTGSIPNCGCMKAKDYTGQKYGMVTFTRPKLECNTERRFIWEGICDCGNYVERVPVKLADSVRKGWLPNCGCHPINKLSPGAWGMNATLLGYKNSAKKKGNEWNLTDEEATTLFAGECAYCGTPPSNTRRSKGAHGIFIYNGIDRVNNDEGYTLSNSVSCCGRCNKIKLDKSLGELKIHIKKMHEHLSSER